MRSTSQHDFHLQAEATLGSLRETIERWDVSMVVMGHSPCTRID